MEIRNLMIGDWVQHHDGTRAIHAQVTGVHQNGTALLKDLPPSAGEHLDPIPLTAEILEKNGWRKSEFFGSEKKPIYNCPLEYSLTWYIRTITDTWKPMPFELVQGNPKEHTSTFTVIEYVHQLQHALRLCGIEKEVVL